MLVVTITSVSIAKLQHPSMIPTQPSTEPEANDWNLTTLFQRNPYRKLNSTPAKMPFRSTCQVTEPLHCCSQKSILHEGCSYHTCRAQHTPLASKNEPAAGPTSPKKLACKLSSSPTISFSIYCCVLQNSAAPCCNLASSSVSFCNLNSFQQAADYTVLQFRHSLGSGRPRSGGNECLVCEPPLKQRIQHP